MALPSRLAFAGDAGADDVAGHGAGVGAFGDVQILPAIRIAGNDKAKPAPIVAIRADEFVLAGVGRGNDHSAAGAEDDVAGVHQLAQGIAEGVELLIAVQMKGMRQLLRMLRAILLAGDVGKNFVGKGIRHNFSYRLGNKS